MTILIFQVLIFLDSHIEATAGWLEALLHRIHVDKRIVPAPAIDNINFETLVLCVIDRYYIFPFKIEAELFQIQI